MCHVAYLHIAGIPFFLLGEIKPIYHVVWHMFVILGAALHWFAVYFYILETDLTIGNIDVPGVIGNFIETTINCTNSQQCHILE
jgi:hypothetical protein